MFLTYVIEVDKREVLRIYFEHIYVLLLFSVFQEKLSLSVKVNNLVSYPSDLIPLIRPISYILTYVIKIDKREVLRLYFKHIHVLLLFLVFPGKLPLYSQSE